ncbi:MAG: hypothetical protein FJ134_04090 [Deltaproteobacteria bacterium]|nr:hypothetical protein [Deltaproteobacteria bacterium]
MKIHEAAYKILDEFGKPLASREIVRIALDRGMVFSVAKDPVFSMATTIEKTIRDEIYNKPRLIFIKGHKGRLIGLPGWESKSAHSINDNRATNYVELRAKIPAGLFEKIQLASQAKLANSFDEMLIFLLEKGLLAVAPEIKRGLLQRLEQFDKP